MPSSQELKVLLQETLDLSGIDIFLTSHQELSLKKYLHLRYNLHQLKKGKPLAYILGYAYFLGYKFRVNRQVFIPRVETEELVTLILNILPASGALKVLDIGTGSGVIPISIKQKRTSWSLHALDISKKALLVARQNVLHLLPPHQAIDLLQSDIANHPVPKEEGDKYDVIVSNPRTLPKKTL